jgi:hypothetical protein
MDIHTLLAGPSTHTADGVVQDTAMSGPIMESMSPEPDSPYLCAPTAPSPPPPPVPSATATGRPCRQPPATSSIPGCISRSPRPCSPSPPAITSSPMRLTARTELLSDKTEHISYMDFGNNIYIVLRMTLMHQ